MRGFPDFATCGTALKCWGFFVSLFLISSLPLPSPPLFSGDTGSIKNKFCVVLFKKRRIIPFYTCHEVSTGWSNLELGMWKMELKVLNSQNDTHSNAFIECRFLRHGLKNVHCQCSKFPYCKHLSFFHSFSLSHYLSCHEILKGFSGWVSVSPLSPKKSVLPPVTYAILALSSAPTAPLQPERIFALRKELSDVFN